MGGERLFGLRIDAAINDDDFVLRRVELRPDRHERQRHRVEDCLGVVEHDLEAVCRGNTHAALHAALATVSPGSFHPYRARLSARRRLSTLVQPSAITGTQSAGASATP